VICCGIRNDSQGDPSPFWNPQPPPLEDKGRGVGTATTKAREQRQAIPNFGNGLIPLSSTGSVGGENLVSAHDPHLDEGALKWRGRNASDDNTEGNGDKAKSQRDTPLAAGEGGDMEGGTPNGRDDGLTTDLCGHR